MTRLIEVFVRLASALITLLPRRVRHAFGDAIGILWFDVLRIRREVALANLAIAFPEMPELERVRIARASLRHMGRSIADFALLPYFSEARAKREFDVIGQEHIDRALAEGKGVLLLGLHLGSGDLAIAAESRLGYRMNLISKDFSAKALGEVWHKIRRAHGTRLIPPEKSSFEILRALKRNEAVIFVLDQFMGPPVGVRTRFFGRETGTAAGLALMADRTRAPVLPSYTYRNPDGSSTIVFETPVPFVDMGSRDENIARMTQAYADTLEAIVRQHPEQWMWIHRRWKEFGNEGPG